MFQVIKQRLRDAGTLKALCEAAEQHANARGHPQPGAEHFVLAALDLPDRTALAALAQLGLSPQAFVQAIETQYRQALASVGLAVEVDSELSVPGPALATDRGPYKAAPSGEGLMQVLTRQVMVKAQKANARQPLLGAHVLLAASAAQHGVCARSFQVLGVAPQALQAAAEKVLASSTD